MSEVLWEPTPEQAAATNLHRFAQRAPGSPTEYAALWQWSIDDPRGFWAQVWDDCGVVAERGYDQVMGAGGSRMPGTDWFVGAELNLAENLLRRRGEDIVLIGAGEGRDDEHVTADELRSLVARAQQGLAGLGVGRGDRVVGFLPNCVETVVLAAATTSLGAIWSSCSPDFGPLGVVDRFSQITPKVLCTVDGYRYNGRRHPLDAKVDRVLAQIDAIEHVVLVDFAGGSPGLDHRSVVPYERLIDGDAAEPSFTPVPFDHPLYVMYSSGTTGVPKSIVHGHGGTLVTHLKEHQLHTDVRQGDVVFWFTTCGWMMWNWLISALASGATVVCYDGSPTHPDPGALWRLAERAGVTHFGASPKFLAACQQAGLRPREVVDLSAVRAVLSTGSPLNPAQYDWVYDAVTPDAQLASVSGGTDLIGCFVCGVPTLPVRRGELQARVLGMAVEAWDPDGRPVIGQKGELVCTRPFPSMPVGFWNDPDGSRYHEAYFSQWPGVWTHGDFIEIRPHGGVVIHGRSDTTLNPGGVRIGTAEIYRAVETVPDVVDSIVVGVAVDGDVEVVLGVRLADGVALDAALADRIRRTIRELTTPRHVPRHVVAVPDVPYTISGKKVEKAVAMVLAGQPVDNLDALANPESLDAFATLRASLNV
ncbi:MAG: acetoacetate--CoA ligase [Egibacteraceae bacterium]